MKATLNVFCFGGYATPAEIIKDGDEGMNRLMFSTKAVIDDWMQIGVATVEVTFMDDDAIVAGQVDSLREQKHRLMADHECQLNAIDAKIQSLLAIEHKP